LTGDAPRVIAYGFVSPLLKSMGESEIIDELMVIISEEERTTAYFYFLFADASLASPVSDL
jgi:hypothetical protein